MRTDLHGSSLCFLQVVYIGVQGQGQSDTFTLIVWDQLFDPVDAFINVVEGAHRGVTIYEVRNNLTDAARANTYVTTTSEARGKDYEFKFKTLSTLRYRKLV